MIPFQFLMVAIGTAFIRLLHAFRRRIGWAKYFSFSDLLLEEEHVTSKGFLLTTLPPILGGFLMAAVPGVHPASVVVAGFMAAFLGVWPVFQFPDHLLDEHLLPHWGKLRLLYALFLMFSTSLAYLGYVSLRTAAPLLNAAVNTGAWQSFLDNLAANAIYDFVKWGLISLFVASGFYINKERTRIGRQVEMQKEAEWNADMAANAHQDKNDTVEKIVGDSSHSENLG